MVKSIFKGMYVVMLKRSHSMCGMEDVDCVIQRSPVVYYAVQKSNTGIL